MKCSGFTACAVGWWLGLLVGVGVWAAPVPAAVSSNAPAPATAVASAPVSYIRDIAPVFRQRCNGCHRPGKEKGGVDLTSVALIRKGGKHGPGVVPGDLAAGTLLGEVRGADAAMPKEGDPMTATEVALLERWIREGAVDDTPPLKARVAAVYAAPPVIPALAYSPDGQFLAVAGLREVVLLQATNLVRVARWLGEIGRAESLAFSPDGSRLAVAGGNAGVDGQIEVWDVKSGQRLHQWRLAHDTLYGVTWSPDGERLACGGADRLVRVIRVADGEEELRFNQHSDWVFGAAFLKDGKRLVSGSRDRSLKLIEVAGGRLLDVVNRDTEPVSVMARHPKEDWVAFGGPEARVRMYRAEPKPDNHDPGKDPNFIREFEHYDGGITALAFSADGQRLAIAGLPPGEVRVHDVGNSRRQATLKGHTGAVFALAFAPDGVRLATAGYEGLVRVWDWQAGKLILTGRVDAP
jgi:dipeptidyl aminopeptidase/acylaminoacyl peptidase